MEERPEPFTVRRGLEVFCLPGDDVLVAPYVDPGPSFRVDVRSGFFSVAGMALPNATDHAAYDMAGDGRRFLFTSVLSLENGEEPHWLIVENWTLGLARMREERQ
jgi:hypothetical protein